MINALALNLIADVMDWDTEEATREYAWLRLMSSVKYDGYSDFRAGVRFLESLATWLRQFQPEDRPAAYDFVKTRLVYLSQAEMQRVIELFIPETVTPYLRRAAAMEVGVKSWEVWGSAAERRQFRSMALDMANRYLPLVQVLKSRGATEFQALMPTEAGTLTPGRVKDLATAVAKDQRRLEITEVRRSDIDRLVEEHLSGASAHDRSDELKLSMVRILMYRYANRVQHLTPSLFEDFDPDPQTPLKVNAGVADGARLHLHHAYKRPLHFGLDDLCDASNENAEIFLQFAGALVARMETRAIRNQSPGLTAAMQESALVDKARAVINGWSFAYAARIRRMVDAIAQECLEVSLLPNARLGAGANAIAIPEQEMQELLSEEDDLAFLLKHALANGTIVVVRDYGQGGKSWCLIELSGTVCVAHGLTLKRGGFLEKRLAYLREVCA